MEAAPTNMTEEELYALLQSMKDDLELEQKPLSVLNNWQRVLQERIHRLEDNVNEAKDAVKKLLEARHTCARQAQGSICEACSACTQSIEEGFGFLYSFKQDLVELREIGNRVGACISKRSGDDEVTENRS